MSSRITRAGWGRPRNSALVFCSVSAPIYGKMLTIYPVALSAIVKALIPHLVGFFGIIILLCSKSAAEANHGFVYGDVSADVIARLKPCELVQEGVHLVNLPHWTARAGVTYVKHPEDELETVTGQNTTEKRHRAHPRRSPVVFQFGKMDDAHVEDYCQESHQLGECDCGPFHKPRPSRDPSLSLKLLDSLFCVPVYT